MSKERELLKRAAVTLYHRDICPSLRKEIEELLEQPEHTERESLSDAEICKELKLSRRSTEWDYGFQAGVGFAEEFHGIGES